MDMFAAIASERRSLAELLDSLSVDQQEAQSLCEAWTVRHVVGHLVVPLEVGMPRFALAMLRHRGDFDRANDALARKQAQQPFDQLVDTLRRKAESRFTPPGQGPEAPLTDVIVHGLDITRPLGLTHDIAPEHLRIALDHATAEAQKPGNPWEGLQLRADDLEWSHGSGPLVTGSTTSLLLALTGRETALADLAGPAPAPRRR